MSHYSLKEKKVLVTGGSGVIGKELLRCLGKRGADVLNMDREPLPDGDWQGVRHITMDLALEDLRDISKFQPQVVFHLAAAFERSKESPEFWETNWRDNVLLSHRLLDVIKGLPRTEVFIFASSYLTYSPSLYMGDDKPSEAVILHEDDLKEPRNACGAAKYYIEQELDFIKEYYLPSLRAVNARIYRVYGRGSKDIVSRWVRAAMAGQKVDLFNKENRFDYVFAGDVAEGLIRMAESEMAQGAINLSCGVDRSVGEMVEIIKQRLPRIKVSDRGVTEQFEASRAGLEKLRSLTGWVPETDLERGITLLVEYERSQESNS